MKLLVTFRAKCALELAVCAMLVHTAARSDPLDQWTFVHPRGPLSPWGSVAYGNGHYVVVAADAACPQILWSSNAVDWVASPAAFPYYYSDVLFAQGKFWLAGGECDPPAAVLNSDDGIQWQVVHSNSRQEYYGPMRYANGIWLVRASSEGGPYEMLVSTNGTNWSVSGSTPYMLFFAVDD